MLGLPSGAVLVNEEHCSMSAVLRLTQNSHQHESEALKDLSCQIPRGSHCGSWQDQAVFISAEMKTGGLSLMGELIH